MTDLPNAPSGYVALLPSVPRAEAMVVQGLLTSNGINALLVAVRPGFEAYTRAQSTVVGVWVPEETAEESRALLGEA